MIRKDITGQRFGMLLVTGYAYGGKNSHWTCKCDCGAEIIVPMPNLRSGNTTKCNAIEHRDGQNLSDISWQKFGRLTVISIHQKARPRKEDGTQLRTLWNCECECGTYCIVDAQNLKSGHTTSCGCHQREIISTIMRTHGLTVDNARLYDIYYGMRYRCYNPKSLMYYRYGGRGIVICDEWLNDSMLFFNWALSNGYSNDLSIDRINNDGNYSPDNCRFSTNHEQAQNTSISIGIEKATEIKIAILNGTPLSDLAATYDVSYTAIWDIKSGKTYPNIKL